MCFYSFAWIVMSLFVLVWNIGLLLCVEFLLAWFAIVV
jgi:hypothetical protein